MSKITQATELDDGQGVAEEQTELYKKYSEGAPQAATKSGAKSNGRVPSSARKQAVAVRELGRTILLLEDEPWLSETYTRALKQRGCVVHTARDAQTALDILDHHPEVALVIVDLLLPQHNGLSFLYEAVSHLDWQDKRYVILSSVPPEDFGEVESLWQQLNVVDYLYKPTLLPHELPGLIQNAAP